MDSGRDKSNFALRNNNDKKRRGRPTDTQCTRHMKTRRRHELRETTSNRRDEDEQPTYCSQYGLTVYGSDDYESTADNTVWKANGGLSRNGRNHKNGTRKATQARTFEQVTDKR
ncbi:uncharacterized protein SPSK_02056 [Sporothrix schenckii 1099-18]|uniref:Uncharacterized protein n=1 Tax=Sporothrix schenckii 1099-18 TaxID=1397361 RepID=A0A0F2MCU6_SPOSC|nr:uncharacterized protein SPSK_02056 [Sporothrix schenckii 1099-18]KJR87457.1 hypothetical protein SPSK_02056 [Sporothrix schenckii 1099-18]